MPRYLICVKLAAILFGTLPFISIGLFFIVGGPDPGSANQSPFRFIGIPLLLIGIYWALPVRLLLQVKPRMDIIISLYIMPGMFAGSFFLWVIFSTETPSFFLSSAVGFLILSGIGSAALYHRMAWKTEEQWKYIRSR